MTTGHTVVRSGKSKRKPFNSNVADYLLIIATFAFSYPPRAERHIQHMHIDDDEFVGWRAPREREVLLMHEVHGVPLQEVAMALGIPPTEAEGLLASARRRVRAAEKAPTDEQALQKCR